MWKIIYVLTILTVFLIGCSNTSASNGLVEYDKGKVISALNELDFNSEIPNLLSFKPLDIKVDVMELGGDENALLKVSFSNQTQKVLFQASEIENVIDFTTEDVNIQGEINGRYGVDGKTKILRWQKDDIYYELFVDSKFTSKEEVLEIANNFYKIH